jgi:hypothetical protein
MYIGNKGMEERMVLGIGSEFATYLSKISYEYFNPYVNLIDSNKNLVVHTSKSMTRLPRYVNIFFPEAIAWENALFLVCGRGIHETMTGLRRPGPGDAVL